jgi:NADPH-dependent curcumin reductase
MTQQIFNTQVLLDSRPEVQACVSNFRVVQTPLADLQEGQVRVKHHYLSLDPYMRGRMNDSKSYAASQALGEPMIGGTVGSVVQSKHAKYAVGDKVVGMGGWQQYSTVDGNAMGALRKVSDGPVPLSDYLGAVGMPGVTAWYGLLKICEPKVGETVVVNAASGAVGSAVGVLAKSRGCRVVGIAGGADKCAYVVNELGFDACIDYKSQADSKAFNKALKEAAPGGIDCFFENVGGWMSDVILARMNAFGRVAVCGMISRYDGDAPPMANPAIILVSRLKMQGFIVAEHMEVWPEALKELGGLIASGKFRPRESVAQGIESAPEAFLGLLKGRNFGKQLVKLN